MKAIILTRGLDTSDQEEKCKIYALTKGYKVLEVVENIRDLTVPLSEQIDVVIVSHISRVTRKYQKYQLIKNQLKEFGVSIEVAN